MCAKNYDVHDVQFLRFGARQMDRRTNRRLDRRTNGQTDRWMDGKSDIWRWVPHLKRSNYQCQNVNNGNILLLLKSHLVVPDL